MKTKQLFFLLLAFNLTLLATSPVQANDGNGQNSEHHDNANSENDHHDNANSESDHHNSEGENSSSQSCDTDKGGNRAPIDGGISILLAAGLGYGVKKVMNKNKIKAENNQI